MTALEILNKFFGYSDFRPGQEEIINTIIDGNNVLAILPTGAGKSICYQIPALLSPTFSIVISPLIALMKDQVDALNKREQIAAFINSTLDYRDSEKILSNISKGEIRLLYLSPEKLDNNIFVERITALKPSYIFVDEAHCISEWGHNFRPSYRKIKEFIEFAKIEKVSAFTATATKDVRKDIVEQLEMKEPKIFVRGFERNNLFLNVIRTSQKKETVLDLLKRYPSPAIIYTATRKFAGEVSAFLQANGIDSVYYHAGLAPELRRIIQDDFQAGRINIISATNAFGMGIDKSDIRTVIHFNLPPNIENYYQEIGRAGRDSNDSNIFLLYDDKDIRIQEYFIKNSYPSRDQVKTVYNAICDYGNIAVGSSTTKEIPIDKNLTSFLDSKEIHKAIIDAAIKILEYSNYITSLSDIQKKHFVRFLTSPKQLGEIVKKITDNELKDLIFILAREYGSKIFQSKTAINLVKLSTIIGSNTDLTSDQLNILNRSGLISYEQPSKFPLIKLTKVRSKGEDLFLNFDKTKKLKDHNFAKLEKMLSFVSSNQCRFEFILNYFGQFEPNYKCSKCDICTGRIQNNIMVLNYAEDHILLTLSEINDRVSKKDLVEILTGKSDKSQFRQLSSLGSCKHFDRNNIELAISNLATWKKVILDKDYILLNTTIHAEMDLDVEDMKPSTKGYYEYELQLFNILRQIRKEASEKFDQSANIICPDKVLREIANKKPISVSELLDVNGFNKRMFNKVGEDFLTAIKESTNKNKLTDQLKKKNIPENVIQILELVQKKYSLYDIAVLTKLAEAIVSIQIETLLENMPELDIDSLFEKGELELINQKIEEGVFDLKSLREALSNKISYAKLRIATAKKRVS